jgi:hypothetical protein
VDGAGTVGQAASSGMMFSDSIYPEIGGVPVDGGVIEGAIGGGQGSIPGNGCSGPRFY